MSRRWSGDWGREAAALPAAVDVLVPTRNRPAELAVTLAGLAAQDEPDFAVVVSDQSDGTPGWEHPAAMAMVRVLRAEGRQVRLEQHLPRRGLAEHRAYLLGLASAEAVLFLDDDVWLEPGALERLHAALDELGCGFVGSAVQGLSYLGDDRPQERAGFEPWEGPVQPERVRRGSEAFDRHRLHNAANPTHLAAGTDLRPGQWLPYKISWLGGCVLYDRQALLECGGFDFWDQLPAQHSGEDVATQWRVLERFGGAGILPSGAVHLEAPTTVPDRPVDAFDVILPSTDEGIPKERKDSE
ncbi:glycosyltransferase [Paenarthrobacter sp. DKR-5]|uniref:glycosyltransferase n=1 Tax=Paenarthrobacter sp. DKR-5 TaxID=2835535 RepID=UPI001BDC2E12|nr:glycosyltransferase family 2 protein [Paenarthrobacter sp. DKR-5]MBT1001518.1 glycosyltransferase [Paenarthrobacter sp. DKR-5]